MAAIAKPGLEIKAKAVTAPEMSPADRQAIDARSPATTTTKPNGISTTATTPRPNDTFGSVGLSWTAISMKRGGHWLHCVPARHICHDLNLRALTRVTGLWISEPGLSSPIRRQPALLVGR